MKYWELLTKVSIAEDSIKNRKLPKKKKHKVTSSFFVVIYSIIKLIRK